MTNVVAGVGEFSEHPDPDTTVAGTVGYDFIVNVTLRIDYENGKTRQLAFNTFYSRVERTTYDRARIVQDQ